MQLAPPIPRLPAVCTCSCFLWPACCSEFSVDIAETSSSTSTSTSTTIITPTATDPGSEPEKTSNAAAVNNLQFGAPATGFVGFLLAFLM